VAATMFRVPWSLLATVESDGLVVRSLAGPAGVEVPWDGDMATAPLSCAQGEVSWTEDASTDPRFMQHASVTGPFNLRFYAAVPIRNAAGKALGLLAVFDAKSRQMSIDEQQALQDLALSASDFLRIRERARTNPVALSNSTPDARFVKALVRHSSEIFTMLSTEGIVTFASGAHAKTIGYEADELVGQNVFAYVHEEDQPRVMEAFRRVLSEPGVTETVEYRFKHLDGHWVELESTGYNSLEDPEMPGVMVRSRDASERKRYLTKLRDSESRYRQLFEVNPQPMWAFEWENHTMLAVNDAALRHYGYSREEFMALRVEDLWTADDVQAFRAHISRREKLPVRTVWRHKKRSGDTIVVEVSTSTVDFFGSKAHLVAVQDITERANAVESLRLRNRYMAAQVEMQLELLKPRPLEECVQALLAALGRAIGASRAYYYVNGSDTRTGGLYAAPAQEWCAPGIFAEMEVFPQERIPYDAYDPAWL
jgi:PAS domain S-box-containing protein